jgi:hypothetical protein
MKAGWFAALYLVLALQRHEEQQEGVERKEHQ